MTGEYRSSSKNEHGAVGYEGAADYTGLSRRTLVDLAAPKGPIPVVRVGRRCLFRISDLEEFLASRAAASAPTAANRGR